MEKLQRSTARVALAGLLILLAGLALRGVSSESIAAEPAPADTAMAHGKYIVQIASCNDCHTPGYDKAAGKLPEDQWLLGSSLGFHGPWGTSYPINIRLTLAKMTAEQWLAWARTMQSLPPMPWYNVRVMTDQDLRDILDFVHNLGPAGKPAPENLPPDKTPETPVWQYPM